MSNMVSIRCRRHKKRFNVPEKWLETCEWLCPKCYEKLSAEERLSYAPKEENKVEIREADDSYATVLPDAASDSSCHSLKCNPKEAVKEDKRTDIQRTTKHQDAKKKASGKTCHTKEKSADSIKFSQCLADLLPRWRIVCKKCHQMMPVHKSWIDKTSKVLCPACYSRMTTQEVREFHEINPDATAEVLQMQPVVGATKAKPTITRKLDYPHKSLDPETIINGGRCTNSFIIRASDKELKEAVKNGRISKIRAEIEFKRRAHSRYYTNLPDVEPVKVLR